MTPLPQCLLVSRELANKASDAHHTAWESLQALKTPETSDIEQWLESRNCFHAAQERFEKLLLQFLPFAASR